MKWPRNIELWAQQHPGHLINKLRRHYICKKRLFDNLHDLRNKGIDFDEAVETLFARWVVERRLR